MSTFVEADGGPAFPNLLSVGTQGMSLRDYFASKAIQGLVTSLSVNAKDMAIWAYAVANEMLLERAKYKENAGG